MNAECSCAIISVMKKLDSKGVMNTLLIPFILVAVLLLGVMGFAIWAYLGRQDYKNNSDKKVASAVIVAKQETSTAKDAEFVQKEKEPLKDYKSPEAYGSVTVSYPKTWSAYVVENSTAASPVEAFFHPNFVPGVQNSAYALKVEVVNSSYSNAARTYDPFIRSGKAKATAYAVPKVPSIIGIRVDGDLGGNKRGSAVLIPLRDKTLRISTEVDQFLADFNNIILPNLTFVP